MSIPCEKKKKKIIFAFLIYEENNYKAKEFLPVQNF